MTSWTRLALMFALMTLTTRVMGSEGSFPSPGSGVWANGLWSDGAGSMWLVKGGAAVELQRGVDSPCLHDTGVWGADGIAGRGSGSQAIVAVWDDDGTVMVKKGERFAAIPPVGAPVSALAVSAAGEILAATDSGLRVYDGALWTAHAYPPALGRVGAMVDGEEGELWLVSSTHRLLHFAGGALREIAVPTMPAPPYEGRTAAAWYDRATRTLWLSTTARQLVGVDLSKSPPRPRTITTEVFGNAYALSGLPGSGVLVLAGQSEVALIEGGVARRLGDVTFAEGLVIDEHEPAAYFANRDGLARFALPGSAKPLPVPAEPCAARVARQVAMETVVEPAEPVPPAHDEVMQEEPYRDAELEFFAFPNLRVALGPAFHMASGADTTTSFTLDVALGGRFVWTDDDDVGWGLRPELGYGFDSSEAVGGHRLVAGIGPMWGHTLANVALTPRFVVGSAGEQTALGFRYGLMGELFIGALSTEVSHQVLFLDPTTLHDVRVTFGVDPLVIIGGFLLASAIDDIFD